MNNSNLPTGNLGALFRVKTPQNASVAEGFWMMDWTDTNIDATVRREIRTPPGSIVMLVGVTTGEHPVSEEKNFDEDERDLFTEQAYLADLLYEDHVYYNQWFYESEWLERFEKVEANE